MIVCHLATRIAAAIMLCMVPGMPALAEAPNPPFPVGSLAAVPLIGGGSHVALRWSVNLPENAGPADFKFSVRQTLLPDFIEYDFAVEIQGETLPPLSILPYGSRFDLWATGSSPPYRSYLLDTTVAVPSLPRATVTLRSEDPYQVLPRTRADRPFYLDVTVEGIIDEEEMPEFSKKVKLTRHVQSYGAAGTGADLDRNQATLISQSTLTTNGARSFTFALNSIPGEDRAKVRGEERFSVISVPDYYLPELLIASKFIQIWPVADGSITGIDPGQAIGPAVPQIVFQLNDLYPDSHTYAQAYKGSPRPDVTGIIVPGSGITVSDSVPANREHAFGGYGGVFDSDGPWTIELLTRTPFGTDRLAHVSFTVQGLGMTLEGWRQTHFGGSDNSGDGADLHDFNQDGLPNLVEFAFGFDPKQNSAGLLPAPQRSGNHLVIDFTPPADVKGILYDAEWSTTLLPGSWIPFANTAQPPRHLFSVPIENRPKLYLRLKVTEE